MKLIQLILLLLLASPALAQTPADSISKAIKPTPVLVTSDDSLVLLTLKQYVDLLDRVKKLERSLKPVQPIFPVRRIDQLLNEELEYRKNNRYEK
jgi:hypothetical protein